VYREVHDVICRGHVHTLSSALKHVTILISIHRILCMFLYVTVENLSVCFCMGDDSDMCMHKLVVQ